MTHNATSKDERHDNDSNNIIDKGNDTVSTIYADLAGRVDQFLQDTNPNSVRRGTQLKVRESIQVIQKALNDYKLSPQY
jgi:hypothetical protein